MDNNTTIYTLYAVPGAAPKLREVVAAWLPHLSFPLTFVLAAGKDGVRIHAQTAKRLSADTFSKRTGNVLHWRPASPDIACDSPDGVWLLRSRAVLSQLTDTFAGWAESLHGAAAESDVELELHIAVLGKGQRQGAAAQPLLRVQCAFLLWDSDANAERQIQDWLPFLDALEPNRIDPVQWDTGGIDAADEFLLSADDLAAFLTPVGDAAAQHLHPATRVIAPTPRSSRAHRTARFPIGRAIADGNTVGIDPDSHGVIAGGSENDRLSLAYAILKQMLGDDDPPGLFLVDWTGRLLDALLGKVAALPGEARRTAIERLLIFTPEQPEIVPLNLVAHPDWEQALHVLIQTAKGLWSRPWNVHKHLPVLFHLVRARHRARPQEPISLLHLLAAALDEQWQRDAWNEVSLHEGDWLKTVARIIGHVDARMDTAHLDEGRVTTVGPLVVTLQAAARVPWLFAAFSHPAFVDFSQAIQEKKWIVVHTPAHILGPEGSRLLAGLTYNSWQQTFYRLSSPHAPIPYLVFVPDERRVIDPMNLERLLTESATRGGRLFLLTESLRQLEQRMSANDRPVAQLLKPGASTYAWFAPTPADEEVARMTLGWPDKSPSRAWNLPSRTCWLRTRLDKRWQTSLLIETDPIPTVEEETIRTLMCDVIEAHPGYYTRPSAGFDHYYKRLRKILFDRGW